MTLCPFPLRLKDLQGEAPLQVTNTAAFVWSNVAPFLQSKTREFCSGNKHGAESHTSPEQEKVEVSGEGGKKCRKDFLS